MPLKFVNLHNHTSHSIYDSIGEPKDFSEFCLKNAGEDSGALAITDHGNMNAVGEIIQTQLEYDKKGILFKFIYGVEAYYIPSLREWRISKSIVEEKRKEEKEIKKKQVVEVSEEDQSELVIEDQKENRSKFYDPINRRHHLVLLAANQVGLKNLFRLVSRSYREGFYKKPRIDLDLLAKHNEGLIVSTACISGIPTWALYHPDVQDHDALLDAELSPLMNIFGQDRFFLELQFNKLPEQLKTNEALIEYSKRTGYKLIATCDSHYPSPELWKDREIYRMLGYQMLKQTADLSTIPQRFEDLDVELYLRNGDQMLQAYRKTMPNNKDEQLIIEALNRTYNIAHDVIEKIIPDKSIKLPKTFQVTENIKSPYDKLKSLILEGLKGKNLNNKEYINRAAYELQIIHKLGVEEYFLAMKEILDTLRKHMLVGPGRGSGAGSLVNYLLNITMVDPIKHGLLFERFLSPSRAEMPDVDSDVELKEESLEILKNHFGSDNVLAISNYNRLKLKSLIKDLSSLYGIPFQEVNEVTKVIESEARPAIMDEIGNDQKLYELTFEKAKEFSPTFTKYLQQHPDVGSHVTNLFKEIRAIGRHAGGILVVPDAEAHIPIVKIRGTDQCPIPEGLTAQYLKYFGLVKFDVLGLSTLKIIRRCIEEVLKKEKNVINPTIEDVWKFYNEVLHPDIMNLEDEVVAKKVYHAGKFPSIFQFAERGVQSFCKKAKPNGVSDISALTSLWRPGPLQGEADKRYIAVTDIDIKKEHIIIQEVLGPTRGILVYQEQFMILANRLAGFTLEEADKLRKLLVKPATTLAEELKKERLQYREKFIMGCVVQGLTQKRAEILWDKEILGFISYGFNKSHAVSYAINSYQCAFLYTYYPKHWIKACLECDPDLEKTINVVRSLGLNVTKPDINFSSINEWNISDNNTCVPPLISLKGIGDTAASELIHRRPPEGFKNLNEFFFRENGEWRWNKLNKKALEILLRMEACESLNDIGSDKVFKNYRHLESALFDEDRFEKIKKRKIKLEEAAILSPADNWTIAEKMAIQKGIIGYYDKGLIVGKFLNTFEEFGIRAIDEAADEVFKTKVWCVIEKITNKVTKTNKLYLLINASGLTEKQYIFKVWANIVEKNNDTFEEGNVIICSLEYDENYGYNLFGGHRVLKVTK